MTYQIPLRIPDHIADEAKAVAGSMGISFNALVAVALGAYLDARRTPSSAPRSAGLSKPPAPPSPPAVPALPFKPPHSRADPCPCGATDLHGRPVKFKHCHGKAVSSSPSISAKRG